MPVGKPRNTFVRHYPKHEFYYAFNKLVMQFHVVSVCPEMQTDVFRDESEKLLGKLCVQSAIFNSNF